MASLGEEKEISGGAFEHRVIIMKATIRRFVI
jgi:hypothetical protein